MNGSDESTNNNPPEVEIPTLITWSQGGNEVFVEGSWDNWTSRFTLYLICYSNVLSNSENDMLKYQINIHMSTFRKVLERSGKDHAVLLVLPSGIYHYRMIVDGVPRYVSELPHVTDERGQVANLLDVHVSKDYICLFQHFAPAFSKMIFQNVGS